MAPSSESPPRGRARQAAGLLASLLISAAAIWALARHEAVSGEQLRGAWGLLDPGWLAAAAGVAVLFIVGVGADKLRRAVTALGAELGLAEALRLRLGSGPVRLILPGRVGGLMNVIYLSRLKGLSAGEASGVLAFDRGLNLAGQLVWILAGLLLLEPPLEPWLTGLIAAALAGVVAVFFTPPLHRAAAALAQRIHPRLGGFARGLLSPFARFPIRVRAGLMAYGVLYQTCPFVICALLFRAFGYPVALAEAMIFINLANLAAQVPGPFAGVGPREAVLVTLFTGQAPPEVLLAVGLLVSLLLHGTLLIGGLPWVPWYVGRLAAPAEAR